MSTHAKGKEPGLHGPSWYDVKLIWKELEDLTGMTVDVFTRLGKDVRGQGVLMFHVKLNDMRVTHLAQSFESGTKEGPKTAPAAMYLLLTRVYHWWEEKDPQERELWEYSHWKD